VLLDFDGILLREGWQPQVGDGGREADEEGMVARLLGEREDSPLALRIRMEDVEGGWLPHRGGQHPGAAAVHRRHLSAPKGVAQVGKRV
jgi:hypothetical protein